jgi:hypothetical protein
MLSYPELDNNFLGEEDKTELAWNFSRRKPGFDAAGYFG